MKKVERMLFMINRDLSILHNSSASFDPRNVNIRIAAELQLEPTIALEKVRKALKI